MFTLGQLALTVKNNRQIEWTWASDTRKSCLLSITIYENTTWWRVSPTRNYREIYNYVYQAYLLRRWILVLLMNRHFLITYTWYCNLITLHVALLYEIPHNDTELSNLFLCITGFDYNIQLQKCWWTIEYSGEPSSISPLSCVPHPLYFKTSQNNRRIYIMITLGGVV